MGVAPLVGPGSVLLIGCQSFNHRAQALLFRLADLHEVKTGCLFPHPLHGRPVDHERLIKIGNMDPDFHR